MGSRQKKTGYGVSIELLRVGRKTYEVQTDKIVVSFHGVELDSETSGVASLIRELSSKSNSRESDKDRSLFSYRGKEVGFLWYG
jgi:hypothetical protein